MKTSANIKSKILKTATYLFYIQGYNSTGINQIIDEAGIAKASLYNHFKSKSELLHAYLEEIHISWFDELHAHIDKIDDPVGKILGIFDFRIERQKKNRFGGCPFIKASTEVLHDDEKTFEIVDRNKMKFRNLVLEILQNISALNSPLSKEELADTLYLLMEGATVTANFQKSGAMIVNAKSIAEKIFTNNKHFN